MAGMHPDDPALRLDQGQELRLDRWQEPQHVDAVPPGGAVQEMLPLDEPVPYRLTSQGRRLVAPEQLPTLQVVPVRLASQLPDRASHVDLDRADPALRARARALRLAGSHTLDIADELAVAPLHVEAWIADLPVPADAGASRRRRQLRAVPSVAAEVDAPSRAASLAAWRTAVDEGREEAERRLAEDPALRGGLGVLSGVLEADSHALLLCGDQLPLLRAAWRYVTATFQPADDGRVLVTHAPGTPGDRVAHDVATALGLPVTAVTATRDPARAGRSPWLRIRVADPALAGRVDGWRRALLAEVEHGAG